MCVSVYLCRALVCMSGSNAYCGNSGAFEPSVTFVESVKRRSHSSGRGGECELAIAMLESVNGRFQVTVALVETVAFVWQVTVVFVWQSTVAPAWQVTLFQVTLALAWQVNSFK